jgi:hypothetical protein
MLRYATSCPQDRYQAAGVCNDVPILRTVPIVYSTLSILQTFPMCVKELPAPARTEPTMRTTIQIFRSALEGAVSLAVRLLRHCNPVSHNQTRFLCAAVEDLSYCAPYTFPSVLSVLTL